MKRCNSCFELIEENYRACPYCGYIEGNPPKELFHLFPGKELAGRYIVGKVLGFGGFGITYKAWDKKLEAVVAIKEYYPSGIVNRVPGEKQISIYAKKREGEFFFGKDRFLEEAHNMAKFSSEPNIINIFEYFEENNTAYIVMEYLEGVSLKKYIQDCGGKVDTETSINIIEVVSDALITIHETGIIHRDISPDNIYLCTNGKIKLIDFGAARFSLDESKMMTIILKPGFAPPEQYEKVNKQGPWTDVYALGATMYYMLVGKKPIESTDRKIKDELQYPHEIDPSIPLYVSNAVMKALAIDTNLRFKNVSQFKTAIDQKVTVMPVAVEKKKRRRRRNLSIIFVMMFVIAGSIFAGYKWFSMKEAETLPETSISMWYCKSGDEDLDNAEENAYITMSEEFRASFPDVTIDILGYESDEYYKMITDASAEKPNIFEWDDAFAEEGKFEEIESNLLSLKDIYSSPDAQKCSLLKNAQECYGNDLYLPLGFDVPVAFINNKLGDAPGGKISSADQLKDFVNDYKPLSKMFDEVSAADQNAGEKFLRGDVYCYTTLTSNYFNTRDEMIGKLSVVGFECDEIYCKYSNVWSVNDKSRDENKASVRFMQYMISSNAQDILHMRNKSENFPVNDDALDIFVSIYHEFEGLFDNKDKYVFEK